MNECKICKTSINKGKNGRKIYCDNCWIIRKREIDKKYKNNHPEKIKENHRIFKRKNKQKLYAENKIRELRKRFEILKRDDFTCQYCGRKAPKVILQIDHIHPQSKGGSNKKENLITACSECNVGKCDVLLTVMS